MLNTIALGLALGCLVAIYQRLGQLAAAVTSAEEARSGYFTATHPVASEAQLRMLQTKAQQAASGARKMAESLLASEEFDAAVKSGVVSPSLEARAKELWKMNLARDQYWFRHASWMRANRSASQGLMTREEALAIALKEDREASSDVLDFFYVDEMVRRMFASTNAPTQRDGSQDGPEVKSKASEATKLAAKPERNLAEHERLKTPWGDHPGNWTQ